MDDLHKQRSMEYRMRGNRLVWSVSGRSNPSDAQDR